MKIVLVLTLSIIGCHRDDAKTRAACENIVAQCAADANEHGVKLLKTDVPKCMADFEVSGLREHHDATVSCMTTAASCSAVIDCIPWPEYVK